MNSTGCGCLARDASSCRHPGDALIRDTPALLALWIAWRDVVEATGSEGSRESLSAFARLDDAHWLATVETTGVH